MGQGWVVHAAGERTALPHQTRPPAATSAVGRYITVPDDDQVLALMLIAIWTARTRRALRTVPVRELSPEELVNFWADDQLEQPLDAPVDTWETRTK